MQRARLRTIVYVDDEPDIREVVQLSLELTEGLQVHTCESGEQALRMVPQLKPDLVLLDVMMPVMDGPATLQRLRAQQSLVELPVIFMTAKAMPQEVARFLELGAVAVIAKPFDPMQLGNQVLSIWEALPGE
jgi:two-component system OmpR family response regulator